MRGWLPFVERNSLRLNFYTSPSHPAVTPWSYSKSSISLLFLGARQDEVIEFATVLPYCVSPSCVVNRVKTSRVVPLVRERLRFVTYLPPSHLLLRAKMATVEQGLF